MISFSSIDQQERSKTPTVLCKPTPMNEAVVKSLDQLREAFRPTPWLFNAHTQLFLVNFRVKANSSNPVYDHSESLVMPDGGVTALYWCGYSLPEETPTVVVLHTLTANPDSMSELVSDLHAYTGWRVVLCLRRGHGDLLLTTPRMNILGCTEDLRFQLDCIESLFPHSPLYGVGASAGSGLLVRYLGEEVYKARFKASFAYCPGYDTRVGFEKIQPFYSRYMAKGLIKQFIEPNWEQISHLDNAERLRDPTDLADFHRNLYPLAGFASYEDYEKACNPMRVFRKISKPIMLLNSKDDPVCRIENIDPWLDEMLDMPNVILVTTDAGSHCAHYEGWSPKSWSTRLIANYFLGIEREI